MALTRCYLSPVKVISLLQKNAREYYRDPKARCSTWSYFTPYPPPKEADELLFIGGLEIYTEKSALTSQVDDPVHFQSYHETVKREALYAKEERLVACYLAAGFLAREDHALPFGGNLVSLTTFVGDADGILKALRNFVPFVRDKETGVLTYAIFTRPKAPKEVLLFVRYKDTGALTSHSRTDQYLAVVKDIMSHVENDIAKETSLWQEIDDSFVSNVVGGPSLNSWKL